MPRFFQTIRNKLTFLVLVPLLSLGILFITLMMFSLQRMLTAELTEKGRFIVRHGAQMIVDSAAAGDLPAMEAELRSFLKSDGDMRYLYVTDGAGNTAAATFADRPLPAAAVDRKPARVGGAGVAMLDFRGEGIIDISTPLPGGMPGALHLGLSRRHIHETMTAAITRLLGAASVLLAAGSLVAFRYSRRLTAPLAALTAAAQRIGAGNLEERVQVGTGDEIGDLAEVINIMAENLRRNMVSRKSYQQQKMFLDSVFQSITYPFLVIDAGTRGIVLASPAAGEGWEGKTCHDFTYGRDKHCGSDETCQLSMVRRSGQPVIVERVHRDAEGRDRVHEVHCHPVLDESGNVSHMIEYAVDITERKAAEEEREHLISDLKSALAQVKTLTGLLPVCAACKKIRDDQGGWQQMECYVTQHSEAEFSHGICPDCSEKLYGKV